MNRLELLDWKRRIFDLYRGVRDTDDPRAGWARWRAVRDELFAGHPQSPLPAAARSTFEALSYYAYDPAMRVTADVVEAEPLRHDVPTSGGEAWTLVRFAQARFTLDGTEEHSLDLLWLDAYGGGLFVPVADSTSGSETYGAGRYLLDTVKGADLGMSDGRLVLDFNFAYQPSCSYDSRWVCPLPPPGNRLPVALRAGERLVAAA